jgi:hypothetical protein
VCRRVLEEVVCRFVYQRLRASMESGMRKAKRNALLVRGCMHAYRDKCTGNILEYIIHVLENILEYTGNHSARNLMKQ